MPKYLKPNQLKEGYTYRIDARNANYGVWCPKKDGTFLVSRIKFGVNYIFEEIHWDLHVFYSYGTVKPIRPIEKCPFNVTRIDCFWGLDLMEKLLLNYLNNLEDADVNDTGYIYCPYIPMTLGPMIYSETTGQPKGEKIN